MPTRVPECFCYAFFSGDYKCCDWPVEIQVPRPTAKPLGKAAHVVKKMLHYCKRLAERSRHQRMQEVMQVTEAGGHNLIT